MSYFLYKLSSRTACIMLVVLFSLELLVPSAASAQAAPAATPATTPATQTVSQDTLTTAAGWSNPTTKTVGGVFGLGGTTETDYTNKDGRTAQCFDQTVGDSAPGAGAITNSCTITNPDGSTVSSTQSTGSGSIATTGLNSTTDSSGKVTAASATTNGQVNGTGSKCGIGNFDFIGCSVDILANILYYIMSMVGYLLGLVGNVFNWVIVITVFQYASYFGNSTGMLVVWGILRDIANIVLLFGFIFMGVMVILDLHSIDARKALPRLIIVAVLLNFSLFASEAVVDVANLLSSVLYKQAGSALGTGTCTSTTQSSTQTCANVGIAGVILSDTYVSTVWNPTKPDGDPGKQVLTFAGITLFMSIVLVLFLTAIVMFVTRAVTLTVLLVISPLAFAGMAIDSMRGRAQQWVSMLMSNAFFAPIFLLLMFCGLKVMDAVRTSLVVNGSTKTLADALQNPDISAGGILLIFGLTVGFFIAALQFAKGSSVAGASFATTFAQNTVKRTFTAPLAAGAAGGGFVGRRTLGAGFSNISNRIGNSSFGRTEFGRFAKGITDKGASATYDARSIKAVGGALGSQPGKSVQGGYTGIKKAQVDIRKKYADTLHDTPEESARISRTKATKDSQNALWKKNQARLTQAVTDAKNSNLVGTAKLDEIAKAQKALTDAETLQRKIDKNATEAIFRASAKGQYVTNLEKKHIPGTLDKVVKTAAVGAIRKDANKNALDKAIEALNAERKKNEGGGDHGGGDGH